MKWMIALAACTAAMAQTTPAQVARIFETPLNTPDVAVYQAREYLAKRVPVLKAPATAAEWTAEAQRLRRHVRDEVLMHGWPKEWIEAPLKVEEAGTVPAGAGYTIRKLRYEIVPGMTATALLYAPAPWTGKVPAVLNVNGHVGAPGKSVEYKQKRCITLARHGIAALSLEWLNCGELTAKENIHWQAAQLELVGANAAGLHYLAMRKGLDYLAQHPHVDATRLGVTGLSGGGWQTIMLSALDERVKVAVPVAGYTNLQGRIERRADTGDLEQNATDMIMGLDYGHLTAMRAPRPTLLIFNAEDDCCFRAPLVKPFIHDAVVPFFALYGQAAQLGWHENADPGTHNYLLDNRQHAYPFITRAFGMAPFEEDDAVATEIKTAEELTVGLPADNLTIVGLARKMAAGLRRGAPDRARLEKVVRYHDVDAKVWRLANTKNKRLESESARIDFSNGLSATTVWLRPLDAGQVATATIVLNDKGKKESGEAASERLNRGEAVVAADLLFTGDMTPQHGVMNMAEMMSATGDRALGLEAAQLAALARLARERTGAKAVRVEARGLRSQVIAQTAAALKPGLFSEVVVSEGRRSLQALLDENTDYLVAPDLFCLDLYKEIDLDGMARLAAPTVIHMR